MGSIPESGRFPWRKKWLPTLVFLLEKFHGQRSLVGYSPWDCKELNVIEHMHTHTHTELYMDSSNKMSGLIQSSFCFLGSNKGSLYFLKFIFQFLAKLCPCCHTLAFSSFSQWRLLFFVVHMLLIVLASLIVEHGLQQLCCMGFVALLRMASSWTRD